MSTSGLDKPSERGTVAPTIEGRAASARAPERAPQRIVIRTAANRFDVPVDEIPHGMSYEWKVKTVHGQEAREQMIAWRLNGWTPVPAGRHPNFSGEPLDSTAEIERGGQVLCERPIEVTRQAQQMDREAAADQVRTQMDRLAGRARETGSERVTKVSRTYEPIRDDI